MQNNMSQQIGAMSRAAGGSILAVTILLAAGGVAAAQDGSWYDTKILQNILTGIGLRNGDEAAIDYRERSPLVIPPSGDLPAPQRDATLSQNPAWPHDPDVERARQSNKRGPGLSFEDESRPLMPRELDKGRIRRGQKTASTGNQDTSLADRLMPSQLGYKGNLFGSMFGHKNEVATFKGEPQRSILTEPPAGYRTPSADQPYGIVDRAKQEKPTDSYTTRSEVKP